MRVCMHRYISGVGFLYVCMYCRSMRVHQEGENRWVGSGRWEGKEVNGRVIYLHEDLMQLKGVIIRRVNQF